LFLDINIDSNCFIDKFVAISIVLSERPGRILKKYVSCNTKNFIRMDILDDDMTWKELIKEIKKAKKDPQFRKELRQFIRVTTS